MCKCRESPGDGGATTVPSILLLFNSEGTTSRIVCRPNHSESDQTGSHKLQRAYLNDEWLYISIPTMHMSRSAVKQGQTIKPNVTIKLLLWL